MHQAPDADSQDILGPGGQHARYLAAAHQLDQQSEPVQLTLTADGGVEQSPEEWWRAFLTAARRLINQGLTPVTNIRGVCCSTQGEGTIPVDRDGKALMNCILWMDMRGAPYLRKQFKGLINLDGVGVGRLERWIRLTGGMPSATGKERC